MNNALKRSHIALGIVQEKPLSLFLNDKRDLLSGLTIEELFTFIKSRTNVLSPKIIEIVKKLKEEFKRIKYFALKCSSSKDITSKITSITPEIKILYSIVFEIYTLIKNNSSNFEEIYDKFSTLFSSEQKQKEIYLNNLLVPVQSSFTRLMFGSTDSFKYYKKYIKNEDRSLYDKLNDKFLLNPVSQYPITVCKNNNIPLILLYTNDEQNIYEECSSSKLVFNGDYLLSLSINIKCKKSLDIDIKVNDINREKIETDGNEEKSIFNILLQINQGDCMSFVTNNNLILGEDLRYSCIDVAVLN